MNEILKDIEAHIKRIENDSKKSNIGTIISVADGVARVSGLREAMYNEMIAFEGGVYGIALNLGEDEVSCVLMGDVSHIKEGQTAQTTGKLLSVPVGMGLLGRVVDVLGNPLDGKGAIESVATYPVEKIAPGILPRKSVDQPLQTGILAVDSMIPIGRGQRELIIGDRGTGKTSVAIDAIINQARLNEEGKDKPDFRPVYSIYVAIGQKNSKIARTIQLLEEKNALKYTIVVAASAAENADNEQTIPRDIVAGYCFAIVRGNATLCKLNNACFAGESACFRTYISFQHREKSSKIGICAGVEKVVETVDNSL